MENVKIRKEKSTSDYTVIPNAYLRNKELSWKAKGLLTYLLSMADDWQVFKSDLTNRSKDGYEAMLGGWKELESAGFIETIRIKSNNLFAGYEYVVHDSPVVGVLQTTETRVPGNPELISNSNKEVLKKNIMSDFDDFWKLYPVKVAKGKCQTKWNHISKKDKEKIFETLPGFIVHKPFASYNLPHPLSYLNAQRWLDEKSDEQQQQENNHSLQSMMTN